MSKSIKKKVTPTKGKNIRISDKGHQLLSSFCSKNGYNLGAFCELGALAKMREETLKKV